MIGYTLAVIWFAVGVVSFIALSGVNEIIGCVVGTGSLCIAALFVWAAPAMRIYDND